MRIADCPISECRKKPLIELVGTCRNCGEESRIKVRPRHYMVLRYSCEHCGVGPDGKIPGERKKLTGNQCGIVWGKVT